MEYIPKLIVYSKSDNETNFRPTPLYESSLQMPSAIDIDEYMILLFELINLTTQDCL